MKLNAIERGNGPETVVFLHGLFGRARNLGFLQREASQTFRTIALDLRNHGVSPHGPVSYPAMAQDVLETLDDLGIERFSVVGHSMGGKVAMMLALADPDRVTRLMVADMAPAQTQQGHGDMIAKLDAITFPSELTRSGALDLLEPITGSRAVAELMAQNVSLDGAPGWAIGFDEITQGIGRIEGWPDSQTAPYDGPALFLRGENSNYVRPEHHALIHALFPQARILTLEGAGHWLHAEQPRPFIATMMAFLTGQGV
ncbi:alpha/beta fold hydrolase [Gluconobacter japonicus]|uniref:Acyl-CoA esterase n=1 Tax=Gluconobacter japonicus TaxID=376620 RepID=A0ABQ5WKX4_GLUJA|nr:alpha/beta fold hydrolase [Gluconobacter japonicus]KXV27270.1 esterase [Gluconobacter japonicus]GLQ60329.1 acyl-CoA esterase [Gluconobacter japonicus]